MPDATRTLAVGFQRHTPPFSYSLDGPLAPQGYAVSLAREVLARLGDDLGGPVAVRDVEVTSSTRTGLLLNGLIDLECGSTTITPERRARHAFSRPVFRTRHRVAVKPGRALDALRVTGISGSTSHAALVEAEGPLASHVFTGQPSIGESRRAFVEDAAVDALVADEVILRSLLHEEIATGQVLLLDEALGADAYGFMLRHDDRDLLERVDRALGDVLADTDQRRRLAAWFSDPLPGLGFALGMDVGPLLEELAVAGGDRVGSTTGGSDDR